MLPAYGPYSVGDFPSGSQNLSHPLTFIGAIRPVLIFILEFIKNDWTDQGDEFVDGD